MMKHFIIGAFLLCATGGCSSSETPKAEEIQRFDVDGTGFVDVVDHRFLPLVPGTRSTFVHALGRGRIDVEVMMEKQLVNDVGATEIRATTTLDDEVVKETYGRYAQDAAGNVWHLGDTTCAFDEGECFSMEGTWGWGVDGGLPGVVLAASPAVTGERYYEATAPGAQDIVEVVGTLDSVTVPAGTFEDCLVTRTWRLRPARSEIKSYCAGVGLVRVVRARFIDELVEVSGPLGEL
ncbi:MAG: hypothetical protein Q8O67_14045 [Deltaproteobacteria bacterium]|nr:hypothetical protein [Deltaproteobacteria bacterium]